MTLRTNFVDSDPTVTDHPTHHNDLAIAVNGLVTDKLDKTGGALTGALTSTSSLTASLGAADSLAVSGDDITAVGSNTNHQVRVHTKGTGSLRVNGDAGDGTGGLLVYGGGATPVARLTAGSSSGALLLVPGAGLNALRVFKESDATNRLTIGEDGKISWSDGTAAIDTNVYRSAANVLATDDDFAMLTAGKGLKVKEGSNAKMGTATLVAGSVVVSNTSVTATSRIFLTSQVDGGTPGFLRVSTRTAGTSFTITSGSGTDTSTVAYLIVEPA